MDMGLLAAASNLPVLLLALHVGVWVDRLPRRPIRVATNLGRGVLLGLVPLAAASGWLRMEVLWGIAFAVGVLAVVFDIAVTSYVPSLVPRGRLVDANATLQASSAAAWVVGPGAGGRLVQAIGAPCALLADAVSLAVTLCHGDWHQGNALLGADGSLHVVNWDTLVLAPRERDLSLIGATWGGAREAALFYSGYGPMEPDGAALAYYRYHRIVEDIAVDCAELLDTSDGGASRAQMLGMLARALRPGGALDVARRLDAN